MRTIEKMPLFDQTARALKAPHLMQLVRCVQLLAIAKRIDSNLAFRVSAVPAIHAHAAGIEFGIGSDVEIVTVVVVFEGNSVALLAGYRGTIAGIPKGDYKRIGAEADRAIAAKGEKPKQVGPQP